MSPRCLTTLADWCICSSREKLLCWHRRILARKMMTANFEFASYLSATSQQLFPILTCCKIWTTIIHDFKVASHLQLQQATTNQLLIRWGRAFALLQRRIRPQVLQDWQSFRLEKPALRIQSFHWRGVVNLKEASRRRACFSQSGGCQRRNDPRTALTEQLEY